MIARHQMALLFTLATSFGGAMAVDSPPPEHCTTDPLSDCERATDGYQIRCPPPQNQAIPGSAGTPTYRCTTPNVAPTPSALTCYYDDRTDECEAFPQDADNRLRYSWSVSGAIRYTKVAPTADGNTPWVSVRCTGTGNYTGTVTVVISNGNATSTERRTVSCPIRRMP